MVSMGAISPQDDRRWSGGSARSPKGSRGEASTRGRRRRPQASPGGLVGKQALVLTFEKLFLLAGILFLFVLPLLFF